ncbi:MAG: hypothetical protein Q8Q09_06160 [Deltaproteobacteria bacterium]|nr:hypothetical protein [Deltaproteobacteria bacterium]
MRTLVCLGLASAGIAGCAPADVAGNYTGALTNGSNDCNLSNFTPGDTSSGITLNVTQSGANVSAEVTGLAALALAAFTGNNMPFVGSVSGTGFFVSRRGTNAMSRGTCAYTTAIDVSAQLNGNTLAGTVQYFYQTNNAADCRELSTCRTTQNIAFVRPPR